MLNLAEVSILRHVTLARTTKRLRQWMESAWKRNVVFGQMPRLIRMCLGKSLRRTLIEAGCHGFRKTWAFRTAMVPATGLSILSISPALMVRINAKQEIGTPG